MNNGISASKYAEGMIWPPHFDSGLKKWILSYKKDGKVCVLQFDNPTLACATYITKFNQYKNSYLQDLSKHK